MMVPKRWLAHVNLAMTLAESLSRGMKMRIIPRSNVGLPHTRLLNHRKVIWTHGCSRWKTASSCAGNMSGMPQTDADAAMMHALRQSLSQADILIITSSWHPITVRHIRGEGNRVRIGPHKGGILGDCVGDKIGQTRDEGGWISHSLFFSFVLAKLFFGDKDFSWGRKNKLGPKKVNRTWSL